MEKSFSYEEVLEKINHARRFGSQPGIEVTKHMLKKLGQEKAGIPFIHVAGTNGKGSVCAFMNSIVQKSGLTVGMFTSPHLIAFEERIQVNGICILPKDVERLGNLLLHMDFDLQPTMFDYCLVMALLYFRERQCDLMIIETGLGGKLDSTNAIGTPLVTIITKIGYDHMEILGDSLTKIAAEKAGIIKAGTHLVLERQEPEVLEVLLGAAAKANVRSVSVLEEADIEQTGHLPLGMKGIFQWENAAAAVKAIRILLEEEHLPEKLEIAKVHEHAMAACEEGLKDAVWPGRMEILSKTPFLMADGAHNGHGVQALAESLKAAYPGEKFHFIMGVMADKDYEQMIQQLLPLALDFGTYTPESQRALQAEKLAEVIRNQGVNAYEITDLHQLRDELRTDAKNIAFGSLYFIGDIKKLFLE